jgi:hypothetical protein
MNTPDYGHLLLAPVFLYAALRYTFARPLFGREPCWPFPLSSYCMSPFSRWLLFGICLALALWELIRGLFHLHPTLLVAVVFLSFLAALFAAYRHDRRRSHIPSDVA